MNPLELSRLHKTWLVDVDGTIFRHNAHLSGPDEVLPGVVEFFAGLPENDKVILLTARSSLYEQATLAALAKAGIRHDHILFNMPTGERVLVNDRKPSGMPTAHAFNVDRDVGLGELSAAIRITEI